MRQIKLPFWVWYSLIAVNVINFGIGFLVADRSLMFLALLSGICCYVSLRLTSEDKGGK